MHRYVSQISMNAVIVNYPRKELEYKQESKFFNPLH